MDDSAFVGHSLYDCCCDRQMDSVTASVVTQSHHQPAMTPMSLPVTTESEPMDLSERSTGATGVVCAPPLTSAVLDQDHIDGSAVENQLHSPARSLSSSSASRDGSEATSAVGAVGGLEPSEVARSQNQV